MTLIVDASVAVKWFVREEGHERALAVIAAGDPLEAPGILVAEVANVAWKKWRRGELDSAQAHEIVVHLPLAFARLHPTAIVAHKALEIALALEHPVYDCFYLACARMRDAPLVTDDARLVDRVAGTRFEQLVRPLSSF